LRREIVVGLLGALGELGDATVEGEALVPVLSLFEEHVTLLATRSLRPRHIFMQSADGTHLGRLEVLLRQREAWMRLLTSESSGQCR
jgi:hypothetical protein